MQCVPTGILLLELRTHYNFHMSFILVVYSRQMPASPVNLALSTSPRAVHVETVKRQNVINGRPLATFRLPAAIHIPLRLPGKDGLGLLCLGLSVLLGTALVLYAVSIFFS